MDEFLFYITLQWDSILSFPALSWMNNSKNLDTEDDIMDLKLQGGVIHFNCGLRTHGMQMNFDDYVDLATPILAHFSVKEI